MLRVNWIDLGIPFQHYYLWQAVCIIDQWTYNNNVISFHLNNYLIVISIQVQEAAQTQEGKGLQLTGTAHC